jgi:sphinganine-1-phosphate aldolase
MKACDYFKEEISKIEDLEILGKPNSSLISFKSTNPKVNIFSVADALEEKGWKMEAQRLPDSIHCTVFPIHYKIRETFIQSLKEAVETVKSNPKKFMKDGVTGMYGTVTTVGEEKTLDKFLISFMSNVYQ